MAPVGAFEQGENTAKSGGMMSICSPVRDLSVICVCVLMLFPHVNQFEINTNMLTNSFGGIPHVEAMICDDVVLRSF